MTRCIDTHAHLYVNTFDADRAEVMKRAAEVVSHIVLPNIDLQSADALRRLADAYPDFCFPAMGLHPCSVGQDLETVLAAIESELRKRRYWAIGETGLDYYWDKKYVDAQKESLRQHVAWAKSSGLPLILHCRESFEATINIIEEFQDGSLQGVFHCFGGSEGEARRVTDVGFYVGIGGVLTYKKAGLTAVLPHILPERILLETDAPYLTPVPHRGKRNETAFIQFVAQTMADALGMPLEAIATLTSANAKRLFSLPD